MIVLIIILGNQSLLIVISLFLPAEGNADYYNVIKSNVPFVFLSLLAMNDSMVFQELK